MKNIEFKLSITINGDCISSDFGFVSSVNDLNLAIAKYIHKVYEFVVPKLEESSDMA